MVDVLVHADAAHSAVHAMQRSSNMPKYTQGAYSVCCTSIRRGHTLTSTRMGGAQKRHTAEGRCAHGRVVVTKNDGVVWRCVCIQKGANRNFTVWCSDTGSNQQSNLNSLLAGHGVCTHELRGALMTMATTAILSNSSEIAVTTGAVRSWWCRHWPLPSTPWPGPRTRGVPTTPFGHVATWRRPKMPPTLAAAPPWFEQHPTPA